MNRYTTRDSGPERYSLLNGARIVGVTRYGTDVSHVRTADVLRNAKALCDGLSRYTKSDPSHVGPVDARERFSKAVHERLRANAAAGRHENFNQISAALAQQGITAPGPNGAAKPWVPKQYARQQPQPNRKAERIVAKARQLVAKGKYLSYDEIAKTL